MTIEKTTDLPKILVSIIILSFIALEANATAILDTETIEPEVNRDNKSTERPATNLINKPIRSTSLIEKSKKVLDPSMISNSSKPGDDKEILNFSVPPLVSGNVLPHIPKVPPVPPKEDYFDQSQAFNRRPSLAWRITARALFSKNSKKNDFLAKIPFDSGSVYNSIIEQAQVFNWKLKDSSQKARHLHFLIPGIEKEVSLILSVKDDISGNFSHIRARTSPSTPSSNNAQLNLFFTKVTNSLQMKDVL